MLQARHSPQTPLIIQDIRDVIYATYHENILAIFTPDRLPLLDVSIDEKKYVLHLTRHFTYAQNNLIIWLTEHGYRAQKSDEIGTYFRQ
jgi:hypothetical protein